MSVESLPADPGQHFGFTQGKGKGSKPSCQQTEACCLAPIRPARTRINSCSRSTISASPAHGHQPTAPGAPLPPNSCASPEPLQYWHSMSLHAIIGLVTALTLAQKRWNTPSKCSISSTDRAASKPREGRRWKAVMLACALACAVSLPRVHSAAPPPPPISPPPYLPATTESCVYTSYNCGTITSGSDFCTNSTSDHLSVYRQVYDYAPWSLQV